MQEISNQTGLTRKKISKILHDEDVLIKRPVKQIDIERATSMRKSGATIWKISETIGSCPTTVYRRLKEQNIKPGKPKKETYKLSREPKLYDVFWNGKTEYTVTKIDGDKITVESINRYRKCKKSLSITQLKQGHPMWRLEERPEVTVYKRTCGGCSKFQKCNKRKGENGYCPEWEDT